MPIGIKRQRSAPGFRDRRLNYNRSNLVRPRRDVQGVNVKYGGARLLGLVHDVKRTAASRVDANDGRRRNPDFGNDVGGSRIPRRLCRNTRGGIYKADLPQRRCGIRVECVNAVVFCRDEDAIESTLAGYNEIGFVERLGINISVNYK